MNESSPETRVSLVRRLQDPRDDAAWSEFVSVYEPLILRLLAQYGLQACDARDVCQQVLQAVARDSERWRPDGRAASFRRWLFRVARNRVLKFLAKERKRLRAAGGTSAQILLSEQPASDATLSERFEQAYREQLLLRAAEQVRGEFRATTWEAFWRSCVEGQPIAEVAQQLGVSVGSVYVARSRIIARLKGYIARLLGEEAD